MKTNLPFRTSASEALFLTFQVGGLRCAVPFGRVAEVRTLQTAMPVLQAPDYGTGTVHLLDRQVPLIDLRVRFQQAPRFDQETRLIAVFARRLETDTTRVVIVVDAIDDVVELAPAIAPRSGENPDARPILSPVWSDSAGAPVSLLDIDRLTEGLTSAR